MRTPIVLVTASTEIIRGVPRVRVNEAYVRAIEDAGLLPVVAPPLADPARADDLLAVADGLLLSGGEDIVPAHYGAAPHPRLGETHAERDASELALVRAAAARRLPTLAICRGVQLLNVALGGTLVQDIPSEHPDALPHDPGLPRGTPAHDVDITPNSRLAVLLRALRLRVNSTHHQSVARIAPSLRLAARSPDGIIEGLEAADGEWWAIGVQWHAEEPLGNLAAHDRALLAAFARAARAGAGARAGSTRPAGRV